MKNHIKSIISICLLLASFMGFAQAPSLYIRSIRSIHLENAPGALQPIPFHEVDMVYNKIGQFLNNKITVNKTDTYEVSGFANINPGVMGTSTKDSIQMEVYLIKNHQQPTETILGKDAFTFTYGNFDVAAGFHIAPIKAQLQANDDVSLWVKILPTSTIAINKSAKYDHVTKPTGMEQIAGMRIAKVE
ncbi:hypothetical protein H1R17_03150 [Flavobacterium sp. xlx-214]|uniref:hypothetical protein n=1 Tax=unclassified Flavobacterium TaxID=196869 RepID=UPI0013D5F07E|nr:MULTISPECIES: hypothetical protein [unclassified Flavobacterium]MBA5793290.1 hypothetical protein [Flavobacterium sp. xlx-221]QMI84145.1 hypothetical protein H1R17_03150 [Flavobacterium sp. xlx-214]